MNGAALLTCRCSSPHRNFGDGVPLPRSPALCQLLCCLAAGKCLAFFFLAWLLIAHLVTVVNQGTRNKKKDFVTPSFLLSPAAPWNAEVAPLISQQPTAAKAMARQGRIKFSKYKKNRDMAATQSPIPELICEVPVAALKAAVQAALTSIS